MKRGYLYLAGLLLSFLQASILYKLTSIAGDITGTSKLGILYLAAFSFIIGLVLLLPRLIKHFQIKSLLRMFLLVGIFGSIFTYFIQNGWFAVSIIFIPFIVVALVWVLFDILLERQTLDENTGKIRGAYLAISSLGILIAPFITTYLGASTLFGLVAFLFLLILLITYKFPSELQFPLTSETNKISKSDFKRLYDVSLFLELYLAITLIYAPIYMKTLGFSWSGIGATVSCSVLFSLFAQYLLGKVSDKYLFERMLILVLIAISVIGLLSMYVISDQFIWALLYVITFVAITSSSLLRDTFFFRRIDGNDIELITKIRTASPVANILCAGLGLLFLSFFPIKGLFLLQGLLLMYVLYPVFSLKMHGDHR